MPYIDEKAGIYAEDIKCPHCKWKGTENDLEMDLYESHASRMPIASLCPNCKNEI